MNDIYLTWQTQAPTRAGLYIRTDGYGKVQLLQASIETFLDGSRRVNLTDVIADYVRGPLDKLVRESIDLLPGDQGDTRASFLGPIKLPPFPTAQELSQTEFALPSQPGIYILSRDLGHCWLHQLVAVNIHRCLLGQTQVDDVYAVDLPSLDRRELKGDECGVILTLAIPRVASLNLQMLIA